MAHKKRALVELLTTQPSSDFTVVLAGIAGSTCRNDVLERVPTTPGDGLNAVTLQSGAITAAVSASAPRVHQFVPFEVGEVVVDAGKSVLPPLGIPRTGRGRRRGGGDLAGASHGVMLSRSRHGFGPHRLTRRIVCDSWTCVWRHMRSSLTQTDDCYSLAGSRGGEWRGRCLAAASKRGSPRRTRCVASSVKRRVTPSR